ncbi:hypothetical protein TNCV_4278901 [Trichonephila clavipes]|nr:hypothetical protein TNCV_4278901 [Trichonephila clavipes]
MSPSQTNGRVYKAVLKDILALSDFDRNLRYHFGGNFPSRGSVYSRRCAIMRAIGNGPRDFEAWSSIEDPT